MKKHIIFILGTLWWFVVAVLTILVLIITLQFKKIPSVFKVLGDLTDAFKQHL